MSAVDDRIIAMKFDNKQFEPAARATMSTLDRLKAALNFSGSGKGLADLQNSADHFSLANIGNAASGISGKFLAMSTIAITAIANIVNRAVDAGIRIVKAFTLTPLQQGFQEYETNLNAIQTILANTQASGATLKDVNKTLNELNTYSDKTIYNFAEMARNIGTFTAAGVDLKTAASSIKGIANLAALSGSNSQQASSAMYQLSQAISAGRINLQDWNSVVNAGMGGTVFQRALAQTAVKMGTLSEGAVKLSGKMKNATINGQSFRNSITAKPGKESWLTSKVLTETLKQFTGDMSDAELKTMGFTNAQIKSIQAQAKTAQDAATKVKTFSQLVSTIQESAGSGWANTFQILVGDFGEAKKLFTAVNNVLSGAITKSAKARNKMLSDWKAMGGRTQVLKGLENIFNALVRVAKPISAAFREIFPAITAKRLFEITTSFLNFTKTLKIGAGTTKEIKRTFAGLFAVFDIGWTVVKAIIGVIGDLFGVVGKHSGSFLSASANVGDFLVHLDKMLKKGDIIKKFFKGVEGVIGGLLSALHKAGTAVSNFFGGFDVHPIKLIESIIDGFKTRLAPLGGIAKFVGAAWQAMTSIFKKVAEFVQPAIQAMADTFANVGDVIAKSLSSGSFNAVFDAVNTLLLTGLVVMLKKFFTKGLSFNFDFGGGLLGQIKGTFATLTDSLKAMQTQIKAKTLLLIASAVAILALSVVSLSKIDSGGLTKAMTAIATGFASLLGTMAILSKISGTGGFLKIPIIAGSMVTLSVAVLILAGAVKVLSGLSWQDLAKGLGALAVILGTIVATSKGLSKANGPMLRAGIAMIPLAIGIKILASAVKDFSQMSWKDLGKGISALAASLLVIAGAIKLMPASMGLQAAGLLVLGAALKVIASALSDMGGMSWEQIAKGLVTLAAALAIIAGALALMSGTLLGSAALLVAAAALAVLAPALVTMSKMSWEQIAKGMVVLAGALLVLAGGLTLMSGTLIGSAALLVAAAALAVLAPVLVILGGMSWESIAKGLLAIAGAFTVIGVAGLLLTPVIPMIVALSAAVLLFGAGMALIGAGALALASAFAIFSAAGSIAVGVLGGLASLIPVFMANFAAGIGTFIVTLAAQGSKITKAFVSLLESLLNGVIKIAPKIGKAFEVLMITALSVITNNVPRIVNAGLFLITSLLAAISSKIGIIVRIVGNLISNFLNALAGNIGRVAHAGANVIIAFLNAISREIPRLADAGARAVIRLVNGMAASIRNNSRAMGAAGGNLASAMISGMVSGIYAGVSQVVTAAWNMAKDALAAAKRALDSHSPSKEFEKLGHFSGMGMANGLVRSSGLVQSAARTMAGSALVAVKNSMGKVSDTVESNLNLDPVITPVLDLTDVTKNAARIGGLIGDNKIAATVSYQQAVGVSNTQQAAQATTDATATSTGDQTLIFEQYNTSPKALSAIEIYRNTKNQFSLAKEALSR